MPLGMESMPIIGGATSKLVGGALGFASISGILSQSFKYVKKNHIAQREWREEPLIEKGSQAGNLRKQLNRGVHLKVPFLGSIKSETAQVRPGHVPQFQVRDKDNKKQEVEATFAWHIKDSVETVKAENAKKKAVNDGRNDDAKAKLKNMYNAFCVEVIAGVRPSDEVVKERIARSKENDLYKALYIIEDGKLEDRVGQLVGAAVLYAASKLTLDEIYEPDVVYDNISPKSLEKLGALGVGLDGVEVISASPSEAETLGQYLVGSDGTDRSGPVTTAAAATILKIV